ncbi:MAG TPA: hypothetical protein VGC47_05370 [Acidimicrobiia bacterium]
MQRHEFDPFSFVFGMGFLAVGLRLVIADGSIFEQEWLWPAFLLLSGGVLLVAAARRTTRTQDEEGTAGDGPPS